MVNKRQFSFGNRARSRCALQDWQEQFPFITYIISSGALTAASLAGAPAIAQTWVTVVTMPYSPANSRLVAYQIDVGTTFRKYGFTYAKGKFSYSMEPEQISAQCSTSRLQLGSDRVYPPPYWIRRVNGIWEYDSGANLKGDRYAQGQSEIVLARLMSSVLDFLCS